MTDIYIVKRITDPDEARWYFTTLDRAKRFVAQDSQACVISVATINADQSESEVLHDYRVYADQRVSCVVSARTEAEARRKAANEGAWEPTTDGINDDYTILDADEL